MITEKQSTDRSDMLRLANAILTLLAIVLLSVSLMTVEGSDKTTLRVLLAADICCAWFVLITGLLRRWNSLVSMGICMVMGGITGAIFWAFGMSGGALAAGCGALVAFIFQAVAAMLWEVETGYYKSLSRVVVAMCRMMMIILLFFGIGILLLYIRDIYT